MAPPSPRSPETLTSVGVDVGTTTTHAVLSRLRVETPPGGAASPEITDREIVHRGAVRETPLLDARTVDVDRVAALVEAELEAAGVAAAEVDTGAVIVTGETARRENAEPLAHRLAADAGRFVAATAGAALEAVLAGRGSGAAAIAAETGGTVANVDVGGGTTNVAIFEGDRIRETRCLDVGGRLVRFDDGDGTGGGDGTGSGDHRVTSLSPPVETLLETAAIDLDGEGGDLDFAVGDAPTEREVRALADGMADRIVDLLEGPPFDPATRALAIGDFPDDPLALEAVVFSGGVGRLIATPPTDPLAYGDLGGHLAAALARHEAVRSWPVRDPVEDIRATVVGAGADATTLTGRTVSLEPAVLPLRNVPVVAAAVADVPDAELEAAFGDALARARTVYDSGSGTGTETTADAVALSIPALGPLSYDRLETVADALASALESASIPSDLVVVVVTRQNCAKALGQGLERRSDHPVVVLDELRVDDGDYLDVGEPLAARGSVPVVVKTLVFGA
ncbi:ethanolamine ammonia-lyase reactivating factor EutA [Natrialbaceae archaeon GCM10025810]|uniref:ethanolamine ammonia-lyase reactivating factor EutA n=1 Tax=Halovalidus salilacus TaxID=3075124 RepID=UPI00361614AE